MYFLPIYIVTLVAGGIFEVIFATVRGHEVNEGFSRYINALHPDHARNCTPLWQVALGIIFRRRDRQRSVWWNRQELPQSGTGWSGLSLLRLPGTRCRVMRFGPLLMGFRARRLWRYRLQTAFRRWPQTASPGRALSLARFRAALVKLLRLPVWIGLAFLLMTKIANYRLIVGCLAGTIGLTLLLNLIGSDTNPMFAMPWYWHIVLGGYAFGLAFMVTEPVSASHTNRGSLYLRCVDRCHGCDDPCHQSGFPRRYDAGHLVRQRLCTADRLFRCSGQH